MLRTIIITILFFSSIYAEDSSTSYSKDAVGSIFSMGEGKGLFYRIYDGETYIEHAALVFVVTDEEYTFLSLMYGFSYGKYLYSLPDSNYHFKTIVGFEVSYEYDSDYYQQSLDTNSKALLMLSGGFGVEWGKRESDSIVFGVDFLYMFRVTTADEYRIMPSAAVYALYNF